MYLKYLPIISGFFIYTVAAISNNQNNKYFTKQHIITSYY